MRHPDPESLALNALGEDVLGPDERSHVLACDECHSEVQSLRRVADAARGVDPVRVPLSAGPFAPTDAVVPAQPPARVWEGIAAELGLAPRLAPDLMGAPAPRSGDETLPAGRRGPATPAPVDTAPADHVPVTVTQRRAAAARATGPVRPGPGTPPARSRRPGARRRTPTALLVAAVAVVAAATGSLATVWWADRSAGAPAGQALLAAPLVPVEGAPPASGDAQVVAAAEPGGEPVLTLTVSDLPEVPGYHGVWLIDADTGEMVALGLLPGSATDTTGSFVLPAGLDLSTYDLVDVSDEPLDGDPTHSGVSLLRGTLAAGPVDSV